jgi:mycoredoxin
LVTVMAVLLLLYAWIISPMFFPRSADLQVALERAADGQAPLVFWKPGCIFCIRLRVGVGPTGGRVSWVDSSRDKEARALVRSKNGGDHTTPTVMFRDEIRTNPQVEWVRALLR